MVANGDRNIFVPFQDTCGTLAISLGPGQIKPDPCRRARDVEVPGGGLTFPEQDRKCPEIFSEHNVSYLWRSLRAYTLEIEGRCLSPDQSQNCATPSTIAASSFSGRAPSMHQPELAMKLLTVLRHLWAIMVNQLTCYRLRPEISERMAEKWIFASPEKWGK